MTTTRITPPTPQPCRRPTATHLPAPDSPWTSPPPPPDHPLPDGRVKGAYGVAHAIDSRRPLTRPPVRGSGSDQGQGGDPAGPKPDLRPSNKYKTHPCRPTGKQVSIRLRALSLAPWP